jgi:hypothetical protein
MHTHAVGNKCNNINASKCIWLHRWGNRKFIEAHLRLRTDEWVIYAWGKVISNDPEYPVPVWAFARRTG